MENFLSIETETTEIELFCYKDRNGTKLYTSNEEFAAVRANYFGSGSYYQVEKK